MDDTFNDSLFESTLRAINECTTHLVNKYDPSKNKKAKTINTMLKIMD